MIGREWGRALVFFAALLSVFLLRGQAAAVDLKVRWNPTTVFQGSVVVLEVEAPIKLRKAEAVTGKDRFPLIEKGPSSFLALVGIDLDWEKEIYPVDIELLPEKGDTPHHIRADLKLRRREYQKQSLTLPQGMVEFEGERLERVMEESDLMHGILSSNTAARRWKEPYILPLRGRVSAEFGVRRILNGKPRSPHSGVDIAAPKGAPVAASNDGEVVLARDLFLSGKTVVIDHGWGVYTLYFHLDSISVRKNQSVGRGDVIGEVGSTGRVTGPHLHFGTVLRGAKVDPFGLLDVTRNLAP